MSSLASLALGVGAGLAPGPMTALVVSAALTGGTRSGARLAFAPLISDLPALLLAVVAANLVPLGALRVLGLVGAALVGYLAVHTWRAAAGDVSPAPVSLSRAIAVNLANPTPWLFWLTVGTTRLAAASATGALAGLAFVVLFYVGLVGAKLLLAVAAGTGRHLVAGRGHALVVRFSALLLGVAALSLAYDAIR